jgi:hypothetical protein
MLLPITLFAKPSKEGNNAVTIFRFTGLTMIRVVFHQGAHL